LVGSERRLNRRAAAEPPTEKERSLVPCAVMPSLRLAMPALLVSSLHLGCGSHEATVPPSPPTSSSVAPFSAAAPAASEATAVPTLASAAPVGPIEAAPPSTSTPTKTVPRITVKPIDDAYDDRDNEGWPIVTYEGLPAVSADGTRVLLVEERDGWAHVPVFGLRVVSVEPTAKGEWHPLAPSANAPAGAKQRARMVGTLQSRAKAIEAALDQTMWELLAGENAEPAGDGSWKLEGLHIVLGRSDAQEPKTLRITDTANGDLLTDQDITGWTRKGVRCAGTDIALRGISRARRVVVFSQGVGPTGHDCDGVAVATAYRAVRLAR
jgi:hypothetical protein